MTCELSVIILAGGQGTRLRSVVRDRPKILAPVNGIPFFEYLYKWLVKSLQDVKYNIFVSVGFLQEQVVEYVAKQKIPVTLIPEYEPLGTLGAVNNALTWTTSKYILVLNGDTIFDGCLKDSFYAFCSKPNIPLLIVKEDFDTERYCAYSINKNNGLLRIDNDSGSLISMGAVFTKASLVLEYASRAMEIGSSKPMMDADFLGYTDLRPYVLTKETFFLDIGTPMSLNVAQSTLKLYV